MNANRSFLARTAGLLLAALTGLGVALSGALPASAEAPRQTLLLEPYVHCAWNTPFGHQVKELGWRVYQNGPKGTPGQNNWKCEYRVSVTVPTGLRGGVMGADDANFTVPGAYRVQVSIDWAQMCKDQYGNDANIWWVGGNAGALGAPWVCMGAPGKHYDLYDYRVPDRLKGYVNYVLS